MENKKLRVEPERARAGESETILTLRYTLNSGLEVERVMFNLLKGGIK